MSQAFPFVCRRDLKARVYCLHATPELPARTGLTFHSPVNCRFCITGMEHGCKSNETMEASVYSDPRTLLIRLSRRRRVEREFNFNSNRAPVCQQLLSLLRFCVCQDSDSAPGTVSSFLQHGAMSEYIPIRFRFIRRRKNFHEATLESSGPLIF